MGNLRFNLSVYVNENAVYMGILKKLKIAFQPDYMGRYVFADLFLDWLLHQADHKKIKAILFERAHSLEKIRSGLSYDFLANVCGTQKDAVYEAFRQGQAEQADWIRQFRIDITT